MPDHETVKQAELSVLGSAATALTGTSTSKVFIHVEVEIGWLKSNTMVAWF